MHVNLSQFKEPKIISVPPEFEEFKMGGLNTAGTRPIIVNKYTSNCEFKEKMKNTLTRESNSSHACLHAQGSHPLQTVFPGFAIGNTVLGEN